MPADKQGLVWISALVCWLKQDVGSGGEIRNKSSVTIGQPTKREPFLATPTDYSSMVY